MKVATLTDSEKFVAVVDEHATYYGGDQKWFDKKIAIQCACGTVAAANIVAYMSRSDIHNYDKLYTYNDFSKKNFITHMQNMYKYLAPGRLPFTQIGLGIWPINIFKKGVENYAKRRGVNLHGVEIRDAFILENIVEYISKGLENDAPVAMLIDFNSRLKKYAAHWVVITELIKDESSRYMVKVSTWGSSAYIDLVAYIEGTSMYAGIIYFENRGEN